MPNRLFKLMLGGHLWYRKNCKDS